jgi:hypothetical protein
MTNMEAHRHNRPHTRRHAGHDGARPFGRVRGRTTCEESSKLSADSILQPNLRLSRSSVDNETCSHSARSILPWLLVRAQSP